MTSVPIQSNIKTIKVSSKLPKIYQGLLPDFFDLDVPQESLATCHNCIMVRSKESNGEPGFHQDTKCCTYHPYLANYLVGGILSDQGPTSQLGKSLIQSRIEEKDGVTPLRLRPSHNYQIRFELFKDINFGRSLTLKCPFLDSGSCSIWEYRESMCALWFCKSVGGKAGTDFWESLRQAVKILEKGVSTHIAESLDVELDLIPRFNSKTIKKASQIKEVTADQYKRMWGRWLGKELVYYRRCYRYAVHNRELIAELIESLIKDKIEELKTKREEFMESCMS